MKEQRIIHKRSMKRFAGFVMALLVLLTTIGPALDSEARTYKYKAGQVYTTNNEMSLDGNWVSATQGRATVYGSGGFYVYMPAYGDTITDLKISKNGGIVGVSYLGSMYIKNFKKTEADFKKKVAYQETETYTEKVAVLDEDGKEKKDDKGNVIYEEVEKTRKVTKYKEETDWDAYYKAQHKCQISYAYVGIMPTKAGKLTVTFRIKKADGKLRSKKVYRYQLYSSLDGKIYKSINYAGKDIYNRTIALKKGVVTTTTKTDYKLSKTFGRLKVNEANGYKITGLVVITTGKNGKFSAKSIKNGAFAQTSTQYKTSGYFSGGDIRYAPNRKYTRVLISYRDTIMGTYVKYLVRDYKGVTQVKKVEKKEDGTVESHWYRPGQVSPDFTMWQY